MIRAAVFNSYLNTWGGGERSTYAIATVLSRMDLDVEVVTFEAHVPTPDEIESFFGPGYSGFRLRTLAPATAHRDEVLREYLADKALFINHSASSSFPNPCPFGLYSVMFPFQDGGAWVRSYQHFICNSGFTRAHTLRRWGGDLSTEIVYPATEDFRSHAAERAREILTIGRFNWRGHTKNQDQMVDAFKEIVDLLPPGWRLTLLGKLNDLPENGERFRALQQRCKRLPISFEINVSEARKRELLGRASLFWHGTGVGKQEAQDAARMEHFGIAIVEAMRCGVIPLCYHLGGPREIVEHARSGFLYRDIEELKTFTLMLVARQDIQDSMRPQAMQRAARFTRAEFDRAFGAFLRTVMLE